MTARYFKSIFFLFLLLFLSISGDRQHVIHAQTPNLEIYVANESDQCSGKNQCFFDDDPDTIEAVALHKAISFAKDNGLEYANIHILAPCTIKPLVVGFEISAIFSFKLNEGTPGKVTISWSSSSETNTSGFRVLRSDSEDGPWTQISTLINSEGGELQNHSYAITDDSIDASLTYYYKLEVLFEDGSLQQSIGPAKIDTLAPTSTPIPSSTPYPTRTTRPTSTTVPTRTPTPFLTATNSYKTFTPTSVTNTPEFTPAVEITDTPTLAEFEKPTSLRPTETTRPTSDAGNLLEKRKDSNPENRNYLLPISLLIIVVGTLSAYFISKKTRNF